MPNAAFIAGDWGTTNLRLHLCDRQGRVLESKTGRGVASVQGHFEQTFSGLAEGWQNLGGPLPAVLCGMVGSTLGWREVPYAACPAGLDQLSAKSLRFEAGGRAIAIAPGLSCQNRLKAPDMMRGEETQILGAVHMDSSLAAGRHILCLPGTHTKWVLLADGVIEQFQTALAGELFDILRRHSILTSSDSPVESAGGAAFASALDQTRRFPNAELSHLLFEVRSRQLAGDLKRNDAAAYLSGLIIGQDVSGAKRLFQDELAETGRVVVIGSSKLGSLYAEALGAHDLAARQMDGEVASLAGLKAIHDMLFYGNAGHAS